MYQINSRRDGRTVATFRFDPYRWDMVEPNHPGVQNVLEAMETRKQMNRTAAPESDKPGPGPERYQDPSNEYLLGTIATTVDPGFAVVEVEDADAERLG